MQEGGKTQNGSKLLSVLAFFDITNISTGLLYNNIHIPGPSQWTVISCLIETGKFRQ